VAFTDKPDDVQLAALRRSYARQVLLRAGALGDQALEDAFASVRREAFLGPGPWRMAWRGGYRECPAEPDLVYQDALFALADKGINNGEPSLHAASMHAAQPSPGERVLMVGAGSGYYAAILAELVGRGGSVLAIEHDAALAAAARANLAPWQHAQALNGDGAAWPKAEVDLVYVCASVERPAAPWLDKLAPGGRLIVPLGTAAARPAAHGGLAADAGVGLLVTRNPSGFAARVLGPAYFIMAEGEAVRIDAAERERLRAALRSGRLDVVRSLRWGSAPTAHAAHAGRGWSLEYEEPGGKLP
jgi:protein-L-isoaspartate(D-aspartate) O-methyltransferase